MRPLASELVTLDTTDPAPGQRRASPTGSTAPSWWYQASRRHGRDRLAPARLRQQAFADAGIDAARRIVVVTDPGSPLAGVAERGEVPQDVPGRPARRRPLQRAVRVRAGPVRAGRRRHQRVARRRRPRPQRRWPPTRTATPVCSSARCSAAAHDAGSRSSCSPIPARASRASATGPSSSSPSPPARTARASCLSSSRASTAPGFSDATPDAVQVILGPRAGSGLRPGGDRLRGNVQVRWARSSCSGSTRSPSPAALIGINPFDQPNVEAVKTNRLAKLLSASPARAARPRRRSSTASVEVRGDGVELASATKAAGGTRT